MLMNNSKISKIKTVIILLLLCVLIAVVPLSINKDSEFSGSDDKAEEAILEINPDYEPWASPIYEPPGSETESLLFCLQTALGGLVLGYGFGVLKERAKYRKEN